LLLWIDCIVHREEEAADMTVFTIGHSTRTEEKFIAMLRAHEVNLLVDVRKIPKSRHNPQFNIENLPATLQKAGIEYRHLPELGGLRHPRPNSSNTGWRNASFRGYADYMQTPAFAAALDELMRIAEGRHAAVMCAEAVPWRCHRSMISDALTARGGTVEHILSETKRSPHERTKFAVLEGTLVKYPGENLGLFDE
jgi:uncharacterized protein (DUF488 family)